MKKKEPNERERVISKEITNFHNRLAGMDTSVMEEVFIGATLIRFALRQSDGTEFQKMMMITDVYQLLIESLNEEEGGSDD